MILPPSLPPTAFLFDFDSTLVGVESLDVLIRMSLQDQLSPVEAREVMREIEAITDAGMEGKIDLRSSMTARMKKARIHRRHLTEIVPLLLQSVTPGIVEIVDLIHAHDCPVFIVSGALRECVLPVADVLHIPASRVHANEAVFDDACFLTGVAEGPLCTSDGKVRLIRMLRENGLLPGRAVMIGDGMSDLLPYRAGVADECIGVGFHREREAVRAGAPHFCKSVDELHSLISSLLSS